MTKNAETKTNYESNKKVKNLAMMQNDVVDCFVHSAKWVVYSKQIVNSNHGHLGCWINLLGEIILCRVK